MSTYLTIAEISTGTYKEKGSKFLAFAFPVESEEEIKTCLANLKKDYPDARHYCYAYRLGASGSIYRVNDDGEPNHSAGTPILSQLKSANLTNVLLVVVRYFGGVKLGVGGLVQAYKTATQEALKPADRIEKSEQTQLSLTFNYEQVNQVMSLVKKFNLDLIHQEFNTSCRLIVRFPLQELNQIRTVFENIKVVTE